jgi:AcrR family transcriptional regulator
MLDIPKIRHFFSNPQTSTAEHFPSREELYARAELRDVENCIRSGEDPREWSLGEHGALIGGPGKPPRYYGVDPEFAVPHRNPLPLAWFEHPKALSAPPTPPEQVRAFFSHLSGGHLAGYPDRPTGVELARIFRSAHMTPVESDQVRHVFACIHPWDLPGLLWSGGMSIHQVARAIHLSRTSRQDVIAWINLFGVPPEGPN